MNEERAAEGVDHLQVAARELLAAARAFLDVVEEAVVERRPGAHPPTPAAEGQPAGGDDEDPPAGGVQRIDVR